MTRNGIIVCIAFLMSACATAQLPPMDDAYYWPDASSESSVSSVSRDSRVSSISTESTPSRPTIEFINVQDTTVTVRIRK